MALLFGLGEESWQSVRENRRYCQSCGLGDDGNDPRFLMVRLAKNLVLRLYACSCSFGGQP